MGLSRTAAPIERHPRRGRQRHARGSGDVLQGNPMGDCLACERGMKDGAVRPVNKR